MTTTEKKDAVSKREPTLSERFVEKVRQEFAGAVGTGVEFTQYERQLASNLYLHIDSALKAFEAKRLQRNDGKGVQPYEWKNVDMQKLAIDAVHRIRLGLDALIKNHIHVVPYRNSKTNLYDLDLRIGYRGKDHYRREVSRVPVKDIRYELVYSKDKFKAIKKAGKPDSIESYEFEITDPFDRGNVVGGFGYVMFDDPTLNFLVIVSEKEFKKAENLAQTKNFWTDNPTEMRHKTLVHRVTEKLDVDPKKVNTSYHYVEVQDDIYAETERKQIDFQSGNGEPQEVEEVKRDEPVEAEKKEEKKDTPSAVLQYKSNLLDCRSREEIEELREIAKQSFTNKSLSKGEFNAIATACDARLEAIK
jgi:recombination protein RecT